MTSVPRFTATQEPSSCCLELAKLHSLHIASSQMLEELHKKSCSVVGCSHAEALRNCAVTNPMLTELIRHLLFLEAAGSTPKQRGPEVVDAACRAVLRTLQLRSMAPRALRMWRGSAHLCTLSQSFLVGRRNQLTKMDQVRANGSGNATYIYIYVYYIYVYTYIYIIYMYDKGRQGSQEPGNGQ